MRRAAAYVGAGAVLVGAGAVAFTRRDIQADAVRAGLLSPRSHPALALPSSQTALGLATRDWRVPRLRWDARFALAQDDTSSPPEKAPSGPDDTGSADESEAPVEKFDFVIVGMGTAGFQALSELLLHSPEARILVVSEEDGNAYLRPPLSKDLWDKALFPEGSDPARPRAFRDWDGVPTSVYASADDTEYAAPGIEISRGKQVVDVDTVRKLVLLSDDRLVEYGSVLFATGASPNQIPAVDAVQKAALEEDAAAEVVEQAALLSNHVSTFRSLEDFDRLKGIADSSDKILVVGGGFLGTELATALARYGTRQRDGDLKVAQVFPEAGVMGDSLPPYLVRYATQRVREREGVDVRPGALVEKLEVTAPGNVVITLSNGEEFAVNHVVVAIGVSPSVELGKLGLLEIDPVNGGIVVNNEFEARRDVFVVGDAASYHDHYLGRRRVEHHDHAVHSGKLAARNMLGKRELYKHIPMFWGDISNLSYEVVGEMSSVKYRTFGVWDRSAVNADESSPDDKLQDFKRGVVYYLDDADTVVGVLLWNVWGRIDDARQLIKRGKAYPQTDQGFEDLQRGIQFESDEEEIEESSSTLVPQVQ